MTWNTSESYEYFKSSDNVSRLITWEDRRCTNEFLATLPGTRTNVAISTGFGCASLFWLRKNHPSLLERFDCAGTIMDFIVCVLCQMDKPFMSPHNAVSWGYFNVHNMMWELEILKGAKFPTHLLPVVVESDTVAGKLQKPFCNIPSGTPVGVGLGDFQCSMLASLSQQSDAVLNIGTSCQLAVVISNTASVGESPSQATNITNEAVQILPFFQGRRVITAASLSGGNVFATYFKMLTSWMKDLGITDSLPSTDEIYQRILDSCADKKGSTSLKVTPTLWGERHIPDQRGQMSNITSDNISLGDVGVALCRGLVENVEQMMSREFLDLHGVQRIVGTGSALLKNQVLQKQVEQVFGLPLVLSENADASTGAALAVIAEKN